MGALRLLPAPQLALLLLSCSFCGLRILLHLLDIRGVYVVVSLICRLLHQVALYSKSITTPLGKPRMYEKIFRSDPRGAFQPCCMFDEAMAAV